MAALAPPLALAHPAAAACQVPRGAWATTVAAAALLLPAVAAALLPLAVESGCWEAVQQGRAAGLGCRQGAPPTVCPLVVVDCRMLVVVVDLWGGAMPLEEVRMVPSTSQRAAGGAVGAAAVHPHWRAWGAAAPPFPLAQAGAAAAAAAAAACFPLAAGSAAWGAGRARGSDVLRVRVMG